MFGKRSMFKSLVAVAVAASIAVVGAKSAKAGNPYNPSAYVYGGASEQVAQSIQSVGNGSHRSVSAARHLKPARVQGFRIITDTLGGNGTPKLLLTGGGSRSTMQ
jgi:hypothetical protein